MRLLIATAQPERTLEVFAHVKERMQAWRPGWAHRQALKLAKINPADVRRSVSWYEVQGGFELTLIFEVERDDLTQRIARELQKDLRAFDPEACVEVV
jgi:hypothetical protein